ncbi:hypothetical protein ACTXT7_005149 [Hymenolepis weldensis]
MDYTYPEINHHPIVEKMLSGALYFRQPYWGSWTAWSACTATCGVSERQRYRSCNGAYSSTTSAEDLKDTCADISRAEEGMERRDCPLQRICPRIAGGWGEWGEFSVCDATCGRGHRRRIRLCNKPFPQGGGVPCQGLDTQLNKYLPKWQRMNSCLNERQLMKIGNNTN